MKKVVLITGASSGIGFTTVQQLIEDGHIVYAVARRLEKMKPLAEVGAKTLKVDVTKDEDLNKLVKTVIKDQGKIDVVFNNAGFGCYGSVEETTPQDARYQLDVNLFGLARLTQLVLPYMRKAKSGMIINTSSMGGKVYTPLGAWYHATKHAVEGWSDCLRFEVDQFGIKVVIIEPGIIDTGFYDVMIPAMEKRSGDGPYKKIVQATANGSKNYSYSSPSVIAKVVSRAIRADKPKFRYVAGNMARPMIFIRKYFGDKVFDRILRFMIR